MGNEITFTTDNFDSEVLKADLPVLIDFWATWCMPCRMVAPIVAELSESYAGKVKVGKLDVDAHSKIASKYGITSIPAIIIFKKGKVIKRHIGVASKKVLEGFIAEVL